MSDTVTEQPAHSPYGPSAAEGYTTCLDYINANRGLPDDTSKPAAEGTCAHAISDECLALGFDAYAYIGRRLRVLQWEFEWDDDDADLLQPGIDRIREQIAQGGTFYGERRVDVSPWTIAGQFGTLDRGIVRPDLIIIDDLKWGRQVPVSPVENKQLVLYALGFWRDVARHVSEATAFRLSIDQPRCGGGGGVWETNLEELQNIGAWIKSRVELSQQPNPPRTASEKGCMWCKRKNAPGGCETYDRFLVELFGMQFEDLDAGIALAEPPELPTGLTVERRAYIVQHRSMLRRWLDELEEEGLAHALETGAFGLLKAVDGRKGRDTWKDAEAAQAAVVPILGDKSFAPRKLKTPTQIGKEITKEQAALIDPHIKRGERKKELVPLGDARPALVPVSKQFEDLG